MDVFKTTLNEPPWGLGYYLRYIDFFYSSEYEKELLLIKHYSLINQRIIEIEQLNSNIVGIKQVGDKILAKNIDDFGSKFNDDPSKKTKNIPNPNQRNNSRKKSTGEHK